MQRTSSQACSFDHSPLYLVSPSEEQAQSAVFEFRAAEEIPGLAFHADGKRHHGQGCRAVKAAGSEEQLAFMDKKAEAGALVGVVWSVDDVHDLLKGAN